MSAIRTTAIALCCALIAGALGLWFGGHPEDLPKPLRNAFVSDDRAVRAEVTDTIQDSYYRKVKESKLQDASLKGMVQSLHDPYSHYFNGKEADQFRQRIAGSFEGVGMNVRPVKRGLQVLTVFDGTPAKQAGIRAGDVISAVNGKSIAGMPSDLATGRIKGPAGTKVRLLVSSEGKGKPRTLSVTRRRIEVPVARGRVVRRGGRKLGVVQLGGFTEGAHGFLRNQIAKVRKQGADALVLDLRGNPGGLLEEGVLVASTFVDKGKIVSVRGRARAEHTEEARGGA